MSDLLNGLALGLAASVPVGGVAAAVGAVVERLTRDSRLRERVWSCGLALSAATAPAVAMLAIWPHPAVVHTGGAARAAALGVLPAVGQMVAHAGTDARLAAMALVSASLVGGGAWLTRRLLGGRRLSRLMRGAQPSADKRLDAMVTDLARRLVVPAIPILVSEQAREPLLAGVRRPVVLIPAGLSGKLATRSLAMICAHELAHLARRDNLFAPLQGLATALLWFNPFAHLLARRIGAVREEACDVIALRGHDAPARKAYAEALVEALRQAAGPQLHPAFTGAARKATAMRLQSILKPPAAASRRIALLAAGLVGAVAAGAFGATAAAAQMNRAVETAQALTFEADEVSSTPEWAIMTGSPKAHGIVPVDGYIVLIDGRRAAPGEDLDALTGIEQVQMYTPRAQGDDNLIRITLKHRTG